MAALMEEREFSRQQSPEQVVQVEEIFFEAPPMMSDASPSSNRLRLETISNENPRRRSSKTSLSSKNANVLRTSEAFQGLLDRLAQQHLQELLAAELGSCGLGIASEAFPRRPGGSSANVGCASASSADFVKKKGSINSIRAKRRKEATEVQAKEILDVWEGDDPIGIEELEIYAHQLQREVERAQAPQKAADGPARRKPWTESFAFDAFIATLVGLNVLWMAFQLQLQGSQAANDLGISQWMEMGDFTGWQTAFLVGDTLFAIIFALDVGVRIYFLRRRFWRKWMNWLDLLISIICLGEIVLISVAPVTPNLVVLRILRFARFARALRLVAMSAALASLQLLIKCLIACKSMLLWSFCLLAFVQSVAGLVISSICWDFIRDPSADHFGREQVFLYYGTFTRTTLSMFEILFANWGPPCRVLVENVSEWYSVFFLLYRCVLGFAILNVVSAVFVQQTMKTASSDEELAFRQKERDIAAYHRKVRRLFQSIDSSGDGTISLEEFSKLVQSPKLKFWMSQLELEYHDLLSLFEFLDNGDGQITLSEFIEGAARLRGNAKALDIWRIETKVEVLFEEVLLTLHQHGFGSARNEGPEVQEELDATSVQDVFNNSHWRHIKTTSGMSEGGSGSPK